MGLSRFFYLEKNFKQSFHWASKAAKQEDVFAQVYLGQMYFQGLGTQRNPGLALKWWEEAARQNDVIAQFFVGRMYWERRKTRWDFYIGC